MSRTKLTKSNRGLRPSPGRLWWWGAGPVWVLAGLVSCDDGGFKSVVSTDVTNDQISAKHYAYRLGDGRIEAVSRLRITWECPEDAGCLLNTPFLELVEPDRLSLVCGEVTAPFVPVIKDSIQRVYLAETTTCTDATEVRFVLERSLGTLEFVAEFPEPFEILSPAEGAIFSREDGFQMEVSRELTSVYIWGECIKDWSRISWTLGSLNDFPAGPFETAEGHDGETCEVTIQAYRSRDGVVDPAVDPETSLIQASEKRVVHITLTP